MSAQGYQTKLNSNAKGRSMLGLAIARLLHTVFVPAQQKWKCSVITCLFTGPLKDVKCSTLLSNLSPPSSNPAVAPYLLGFECSTFCLSGTACATIWCPLESLGTALPAGEWLPLTVIGTQAALPVKLNK